MNIILELNRKYDRLKEPWRLLATIILIVPSLTIVSLEQLDLVCRGLAAAWLLTVIYVRMISVADPPT